MRTMKAFRLAIAAAIALFAGVVIISQASAQQPFVGVGSATVSTGSTGSVDLEAINIGPPGLGAWEVGIVYDSSLLTPTGCTGLQGSVCNTDFASNRVQVVGANANGLDGTMALASISFRCDGEGASELSLVVDEFSDATTGGPRPINPGVKEGLITCSETGGLPGGPTQSTGDDDDATATPAVTTLPDSGQGTPGGSSTFDWLIAAAASLGLVTLVSLGAARLFARRAGS